MPTWTFDPPAGEGASAAAGGPTSLGPPGPFRSPGTPTGPSRAQPAEMSHAIAARTRAAGRAGGAGMVSNVTSTGYRSSPHAFRRRSIGRMADPIGVEKLPREGGL